MYEILNTLTNILLFFTLARYFVQVRKGSSVPNPAAWLIWAVSLPVNAVTYLVMVDFDIKKSAVFVLAAVGIVTIFLYSWQRHKFSKLQVIDIFAVALTCVLFLGWLVIGGAEVFNLAIQIAVFLGYWPIAIGLIRKTNKEVPLSWLMGTSVYALQIAAMTVNSIGCTWYELANPFINGIIGNGTITAIVYWQQFRSQQ